MLRRSRSTTAETAHRRPNRTTKNLRARAARRAARRRDLLVALLSGAAFGALLALGYVPSAL